MTVRDVDRGAKALIERLGKKPRVKVGVIGSKAAQSHRITGDTVADIATVHEFGLGVPKRSFIRDYVDENEPTLKKWLRNAGKEIIKGEDPKKVLQELGVVIEGEMKDRISDRIPPPLDPRTIARKGDKPPLIDTGQLRSSITSVTEMG